MKMKRVFAAGALLLALTPNFAAAQEYYTLPEIREQAKDGWHESYTDKYGRETVVDIDVEVYGGENAPVLKVGWGKYGKTIKDCMFMLECNPPIDTLMKAKQHGGKSTYIYEFEKNMKVDLDQKYGEEYGNELTLREAYDLTMKILKEHEMPVYDYLYELPRKFSVVYSVNPKTNEVLAPAFYNMSVRMKKRGLPIFNNAGDSYISSPTPWYNPAITITMKNQNEYSIYEPILEEEEALADDIPLCSLDKVIQSIESKIKEGYIQNVVALRFGYSIYNDPAIEKVDRFSGYDADYYYLVPSWIVECAYVDNPKKDYQSYYEPQTRMITINAQTGEMLDRFDKSYKGYGDARYKGFIPWDKVK